jgi:hypothetical protein
MISLTVNGVAYSYPQTGDQIWGDGATQWASAITSGTLQKAGGIFQLTADTDFGTAFGLKSLYLKSRNANPSATGILRLGSAESVSWRNNANTGDLALATNVSDVLQFNSISLADISSAQTLTNKSISGATNTFSAVPYSGLSLTGSIVNADVSASAAIVYSKLSLTNNIVNADISASAAISYSKLNLAGAILNSDLAGSIAYSKLSLATSILNSDISATAAIARTKLAALAVSKLMVTDASGFDSASAVTSTEAGYLSGVTSAIQTQINAQIPKTTYTAKGSILAATAASTPSNLSAGSFGQVLTVDASQATGLKWSSPATGTKNYPTNPNFESNATTGWSLSHTTLSSLIPNQVAGSWTAAAGTLAISSVSSGQLAGSYSLSLASSAATTAGDMLVSSSFTIDKEDQAKVLTFKFYYSAITNPANVNFSGTSSNTFAVYIYDATNNLWIQPSGVYGMTQGSGVGICSGNFQTTANSTQYRIAVVSVHASSGATTLYFDDFFVGPQSTSVGPVVTDFQSYTPTIGAGFGTATAVTMFWKRVGDTVLIQGTFQAGTLAASVASVSLPLGLVSSASINTDTVVGNWVNNTGSATAAKSGPLLIASSANTIYFGVSDYTTGISPQVHQNGNVVATSNTQLIYFNAVVPITGWSSNVQMSSDTDTRVISFSGSTNSQAVTAGVDITFTASADKTNSWNGTQFKVPVSGDYSVSGGLGNSVTTTPSVFLNGVQFLGNYWSTAIGGYQTAGSVLLTNCKAGDLISLQSNATGTLSNATLFINRLSGPSVIANTESVNARYFNTVTAISSTPTAIAFTSSSKDSHSAYSGSTYTIPTSGTYAVVASASILGTYSAGVTSSDIYIYKNGVVYADFFNYASASNALSLNIHDLVSCVAGDTIQIYVSTLATSPSLQNSNRTFFSIARIGN